jgi:hypothetical protein
MATSALIGSGEKMVYQCHRPPSTQFPEKSTIGAIIYASSSSYCHNQVDADSRVDDHVIGA